MQRIKKKNKTEKEDKSLYSRSDKKLILEIRKYFYSAKCFREKKKKANLNKKKKRKTLNEKEQQMLNNNKIIKAKSNLQLLHLFHYLRITANLVYVMQENSALSRQKCISLLV